MSTSGPPSILIVEDEAIISLDIKRLLSGSGYSVAGIVATAEQALKAIQSAPPDLILMDIHLKGGPDGIETASQIRKTFHLPVVFVSVHSDKATLERARDTEPFGYIVKPISALSLTCTIEMALHKHRVERHLEEQCAWLTSVLQTIPDALIVTDLTGQIQFLNSNAEQLLGARQTELAGLAIDHAMDLSADNRPYQASQLLEKGELRHRVSLPKNSLLTRTAQGTKILIEGEVAVTYHGNQPVRGIFTLRDVSRREQAKGA